MGTIERPPAWLTYSVAGASLIAILDLPYGYYQFLRITVTAYAGYMAYLSMRERRGLWPWGFAFVAILYNPVFVISMSKSFHGTVNLATSALFILELHRAGSQPDQVIDLEPPQKPSVKLDIVGEKFDHPSLLKYWIKAAQPPVTALLIVLSAWGLFAVIRPDIVARIADLANSASPPQPSQDIDLAEFDTLPSVAPIELEIPHSVAPDPSVGSVWAGHYKGEFEGGADGDLRLVEQTGDELAISIEISGPTCVGSFEGFVTATSPQNLIIANAPDPSGNACTISLFRRGNRIDVTEESCTYYHGAACSFSGTARM